MSKSLSPSVGRILAALAVSAGLAACSGETKPVGSIGHVKGFGGLVAADEPRAVVAARDVLSAGGTAADAAVALYFTLAVTQPSTASLGGGGSCVVFDRDKKKTEVVEFVAPPSAVAARSPNSVPANVRGFYALHAKYGKLRWEQVLSDSERLARVGVPVSRSFAADLARGAQLLAQDPASRALFFRDGRPLAEGQLLEQRDLAGVIGRLRRSPGDLYVGALARELVAAVGQAGGSLTIEDLRDTRPIYREPLSVKVGQDVAFFPPPPSVAGGLAAQITAALAERWDGAKEDERPHLLAEAAARAFADRSNWMQPHGWPTDKAGKLAAKDQGAALLAGYNPEKHAPVEAAKSTDAIPAAGFVTMDSAGSAVACSVTNYGLFGSGKVAPGTGIVLAAVPGLTSGPPALGGVLVVNTNSNEAHFGAAASGGVTAPTTLAQVLLTSVVEGRKLEDAVAQPRIHHSGSPDVVFVEAGERAADATPLTKRGHEVKAVPIPSRVNAFYCASGEPGFGKCSVTTDPRGNGLSSVVGKD